MRRYTWVLFDIDDTLLDFGYAARLAFSTVLTELGVVEEPHHFDTYQECNHAAWSAFESGAINALQLRRKRFEDFQHAVGLTGLIDPFEMNALFLNHVIDHTLPIPGALELLEQLHPSTGMAVVTNGLREVQRPRIQRAGMEPYFASIVVSDEIGLAKPGYDFFAYAHQAIGTPDKAEVLVVGDSLQSDVQGANAFGYASCWYNPGKKENTHRWQPHFEVQSLDQVLDILDGSSKENRFG